METFDPLLDQRAFRAALSAYATGVTVVTTNSADGPIGITANSFASVSLAPPLVLWSPAKSSKRFKYFTGAKHFAIHVLAGHQQQLCNDFTRDKSAFDGIDWAANKYGVPLINGCLARFECILIAEHNAGDHTIIVGQVTDASTHEGIPLLFQAGKFVSIKD